MRIFLTIIFTGILAFVPVQLESLERSFDGGKPASLIKTCADHAVDTKGSSTKVRSGKEAEEKIYRKNKDHDEMRLQKYIHRSIAGDGPENEPLTRRYTPYKHETVRSGPLTGPNWYRRKIYHSRRDFETPKRRAMDNEEPELVQEEGVEHEDTDPGSSYSSGSVSNAEEETTSESVTVEKSLKNNEVPEIVIAGTEKLDGKKSASKMLGEGKKSETLVVGDSIVTLKRKKGKKKKPHHKHKPKPYPGFHVQAQSKSRNNGGDDSEPISNLGENVDYVATANEDYTDDIPEVEGLSMQNNRPAELSNGASKREEDDVEVVMKLRKEKEKEKIKRNEEDEEKDNETPSRVGKQRSRTKSGENKPSARNSTPDEEVPEAEEAPRDNGDQEVVSSEENLVKHDEGASARKRNYKVSSRGSPARFKGASRHSTGSSIHRDGLRGSKKGNRLSARYIEENDDRADYSGQLLNQNINGNNMRYFNEGQSSPLTESAVARILQKILGMGRAYTRRYDDRDFGHPQSSMRRRLRPDEEPLYLA